MSKNRLKLFALVTALLVVAAVFSSYQRAPQTDVEKAALFSKLLDDINLVTQIEIHDTEHHTRIKRVGQQWILESRDGYPARFDQVQEAVLSIAQLRILEGKTANPDFYTRLDVEGTKEKPGKSTLVSMRDSQDNIIAALTIGKPRSKSNDASPSLYVRKSDESRALLVEGRIEINADPAAWMEDLLLNIKADSISEVIIDHDNASQLHLVRNRENPSVLELLDIEPGYQLKSRASLNGLMTALEELRFEDVMAKTRFGDEGEKTVTRYRTLDDITITATTQQKDKQYYTDFTFSYENRSGNDPKAAEKQAYVEQIGRFTAAWKYRLPAFKGKLMTRQKAKLLRKDPSVN